MNVSQIKSTCFKRGGKWYVFCGKCAMCAVLEPYPFMPVMGTTALASLISHMNICRGTGKGPRVLALHKMISTIAGGFPI